MTHFVKSIVACSIGAVAVAATTVAVRAEATVTTLAAPARGTIAMPTALARLPDRSLLIADGDTGAIFRVASGITSRVVAPGAIGFPTALLATPDRGTLVADSTNSCIAKISGASITEFAGQCGNSGTADGPAGVARFLRPMDLTLDPQGRIYVADLGVGVRRIDTDGSVTTILPDAGTDVVGVSWGHDGDGDYLFVGRESGISICNANVGHCDFAYTSATLPVKKTGFEGDRAAGLAYHLAAFSRYDAVYTDPRNHRVRYLHFDQILPVAGGLADDQESDSAGLGDGSGQSALFNTPLGILRDTDGSYLVADAGNHAIRRITGLAPIVETPDAKFNFTTRYPTAPGTRRIAMLGTSAIWWNTERTGSIENLVETAVAQRALPKARLRIFPAVYPAASLDALASIADEVLSEGAADAIILDVDTTQISQLAQLPGSQDHPESWQPAFAKTLESLRAALAAKHVALAIVMIPFSSETEPYELFARQLTGGGPTVVRTQRLYEALRATVASSKIPYYDPMPAMRAVEQRADHKSLFGSFDEHLSAYGRAVVARGLSDFILKTWFDATSR